jgi:hypothetical protein
LAFAIPANAISYLSQKPNLYQYNETRITSYVQANSEHSKSHVTDPRFEKNVDTSRHTFMSLNNLSNFIYLFVGH